MYFPVKERESVGNKGTRESETILITHGLLFSIFRESGLMAQGRRGQKRVRLGLGKSNWSYLQLDK